MAIADISRLQPLLAEVKSVLVVLPQNPTVDTAAAGIALALALDKSGTPAVVSSPNPMTVELNRLIGVDRVREDLGDKNLVISFADYPAENIERVAYNIENGEFMLTIVPKPGNTAPRDSQIKASFSGVAADLVIVVGTDSPQDLGKFASNKEILERDNLAVLSNNPVSGWSQAIELIDPSAASVSEVAYALIEQLGLPMDEDVSTNLFSGIESGTANFASPKVGAETFTKAAALMKNGAQRSRVEMQTVRTPARPREDIQRFKDTSLL